MKPRFPYKATLAVILAIALSSVFLKEPETVHKETFKAGVFKSNILFQQTLSKKDSLKAIRDAAKAAKDSAQAAEKASRKKRDSISKALRALEKEYKQSVRDSIQAARKTQDSTKRALKDLEKAQEKAIKNSAAVTKKDKKSLKDTEKNEEKNNKNSIEVSAKEKRSTKDSLKIKQNTAKPGKNSAQSAEKMNKAMRDSISKALRSLEKEYKNSVRDSIQSERKKRDSTEKALKVFEKNQKKSRQDSIKIAKKGKKVLKDSSESVVPEKISDSRDTTVLKPIPGDSTIVSTSKKTVQAAQPIDTAKLRIQNIISLKSPHPGQNGKLTEKEMQVARIAWKYFENNYQPTTGLVNNVDNFPNTTMWDAASSLGGLVSAYELGIINKVEFDKRMLAFWQSMQTLPLFKDEMPNKVYHTVSMQEVGYSGEPGEIGFSALDLGRFLIWARIIKERYPEYGDLIDKFIMRWDFCKGLDKDGQIQGAAVLKDGSTVYLQEGRLGYEEYGAKGFQLWGFNTERASMAQPYTTRTMYGIEIPYDSRDPRVFGAHNYVVSESYVLDGIELNWDTGLDSASTDMSYSDPEVAEFAQRIYQVQEARYKATNILTARSEHQLDQPPYFVYDAVYTDGYPWNTITDEGKFVPQFAAVALKAAFGIWSLWDTQYSNILYNVAAQSYDPNKGFYEGIYEKDSSYIKAFTANNNGIILTCLLYKAQGKLLRFSNKETLWDKNLQVLKTKDCIRERLLRDKR
ncbi:MAG: DUF3131 domain-containing protein [Bacteroidota bacterium]